MASQLSAQEAIAQSSVTQAAADPIAQAEQFIHQNRYAKAKDILSAHPPITPEQTLRWHWAMAILLQRQSAPRAAIPHLERLVSLAPADKRFHLELGVALAAAGSAERARHHFDLARGAGLTPEEEAGIARVIAGLDESTSWDGFFRFAVVPESNAVRRTSAETVLIGNVPFRLSDTSREASATGVQLGFGLGWLPQLAPDLRARLGFALDAKLYGGQAADDISLRNTLGLLQFGDRERRIGAEASFTHRWVDGQLYATSPGILFSYAGLLGTRGRLSARVNAEWITHEQFPNSDGRRSAFDLEYSHVVTPQFVLRFGAKLAAVDAKSALESEQSVELRLGGSYGFEGGLIMGLDVALSQSHREAVHPLFGLRRKDRLGVASVRLLHRDFQIEGFAPVLELGYERRQSNIEFYSYENLRASVGVTRQF